MTTSCVHDHTAFTSRWGSEDRLGAGNLITPASRLAALQRVTEGHIFDLSHVIENGAPRMAPNQTPFVMTLGPRADNVIRCRRASGATNDAGTTLERIEMTTHVGTHIDALGHATIGEYMYNGHRVEEMLGDFGLNDLGIEHVPPILTRSVCLDVSGLDGGDFLEAGRVVQREELERVCEAQNVSLAPGDVVCIYTGWQRFFMQDNDRYVSGEPGIDEVAARWLTEHNVVAIGTDNMAVEVIPHPKHPEIVLPVHQHALVESGVYLIENLALAELAQNQRYVFCFILLATKFKGATGCPVRPVALV